MAVLKVANNLAQILLSRDNWAPVSEEQSLKCCHAVVAVAKVNSLTNSTRFDPTRTRKGERKGERVGEKGENLNNSKGERVGERLKEKVDMEGKGGEKEKEKR